MNSKYSGVLVALILAAVVFTFTNAAWYSNNRQSQINSIAFGPSIRAEDGRTIFNLDKMSMWSNLRKRVDKIFLSILYLDNVGQFNSPLYATQIALSDEQIGHLQAIAKLQGFSVAVDSGLGLTLDCDDRRTASVIERAVAAEMRAFNRLIQNGIRISNVTIDGPFLRLIHSSRKGFSCGVVGKGYSIAQTVQIVSGYIDLLKKSIESAQSAPVQMDIILNFPNWRYGEFMEISWGTSSRWMNQAVDLEEVLSAFVKQTNPPAIHEFILDYPYNFVVGHSHRKLVAGAPINEALCGPLTHCVSMPPEAALKGKIEKLVAQIQYLNPRPGLSFITNTSGEGLNACIEFGSQPPFLLPFQNNKCLDLNYPLARRDRTNALLDQDQKDKSYIVDSLKYYNLVRSGLPQGIAVNSIYFMNWHANPRLMSVYASQVVNIVNQNP